MSQFVVRGNHKALFEGCRDYRERIRHQLNRHPQLRTPFTERVSGKPVRARIDFGRWLADCECGGAEYVEPSDPIFYCFHCGNAVCGGDARLVEFPSNVETIEAIVLARPVTLRSHGDPAHQALTSLPNVFPRNWDPDEGTLSAARKNREWGLPAVARKGDG